MFVLSRCRVETLLVILNGVWMMNFVLAVRRYEASSWLRKMVGIVAAKDLPAEPLEEEFRLGLRSGLILCNVLNKVEAGSVPKVAVFARVRAIFINLSSCG